MTDSEGATDWDTNFIVAANQLILDKAKAAAIGGDGVEATRLAEETQKRLEWTLHQAVNAAKKDDK